MPTANDSPLYIPIWCDKYSDIGGGVCGNDYGFAIMSKNHCNPVHRFDAGVAAAVCLFTENSI